MAGSVGMKSSRKNPAHISEFSHDIAADSGSDDDEEESSLSSDKPVCQYGSRCYRSNPAHLREYYHPPPGEPEGKPASRSRPKRSRAAKEKKSLVEGDSDDDGQPNTYDYKDSFIDDDDDDDDGISGSSTSYSDSDDGNWVAPTGDAVKGESKEDESEDLNELLADADGFISNKKMRR